MQKAADAEIFPDGGTSYQQPIRLILALQAVREYYAQQEGE